MDCGVYWEKHHETDEVRRIIIDKSFESIKQRYSIFIHVDRLFTFLVGEIADAATVRDWFHFVSVFGIDLMQLIHLLN